MVENGDTITFDVPGRRLQIEVDEATLARRRAAWWPPTRHTDRGYVKLYVDHVLQADRGVDFDFLVGRSGARVPRDNHRTARDSDMTASTIRYTGVLPVAPTPFTDSGDLDLDGQRRVLDCMIDQGVDGICILANYSGQFLLTDDERYMLVDTCLAHVAGRVPVIVACSHCSTRIVMARARRRRPERRC